VQEPLDLLEFLPSFPAGNLDNGHLKFHINLTHATSLDPDFLLKRPQDPPQPTGDAAFQS
jgi:hypothetical protein